MFGHYIYIPFYSILLTLLCLVIENFLLQGKNSTWERVKTRNQETIKDFCYYLIELLPIKKFLGILFTIGIFQILTKKLYSFNLYSYLFYNNSLEIDFSFIPSFFIQFFLHTFIYYWAHRLMHTRFFWPYHRIHHSALSFNLVTTHRSHPLEFSLMSFTYILPAMLFPINHSAIFIYLVFNSIYQKWAHSNYFWKNSFLKNYILISTQDHRLHHHIDEMFQNKNFGIIILWDKLFKTWEAFDKEKKLTKDFPIGIKNNQVQNSYKDIAHEILFPLKNLFTPLNIRPSINATKKN